jgi:hypothetical protein
MASCLPLILSAAVLPPPSSNFHQDTNASSAAPQHEQNIKTTKTQTAKQGSLSMLKPTYQQ